MCKQHVGLRVVLVAFEQSGRTFNCTTVYHDDSCIMYNIMHLGFCLLWGQEIHQNPKLVLKTATWLNGGQGAGNLNASGGYIAALGNGPAMASLLRHGQKPLLGVDVKMLPGNMGNVTLLETTVTYCNISHKSAGTF